MTHKKSDKSSRRTGQEQWRKRVNEAFAAWWRARKNNERLIKISDEKERERAFEKSHKELSVASHRFNQEHQPLDSLAAKAGKAILAPLDGEVWPWPISKPGVELKSFYITNPEADSIFRTLVFFKYGMTFRELIVKAETDREAHHKLLKIHRDWYRV